MATDSPDSDSPQFPSKRPKISPNSSSSSTSVCAICFGEDDDGRAIRGEIDCCDHFFCFFCIMEWSKTESRCPVCRRRFAAIRRPPKLGVFPLERLISVPTRDQACNGIGTSGNGDPYAEVSCTVCRGAGDDYLMLLCDLCDSASHTYCVGLGATVPEGDWFCADCSVSRPERDTDDDDHQVLSRLKAKRTPLTMMTTASKKNQNPNPNPNQNRKRSNGSVARTLDRSRSVLGRIRAMRNNWNSLRSGALSFYSPPNSVQLSGSSSSSSSAICQVSRDQDGFGSYDVNRAWKMMDMAKTSFGSSSSVKEEKVQPREKVSCVGDKSRASLSLVKQQPSDILNVRPGVSSGNNMFRKENIIKEGTTGKEVINSHKLFEPPMVCKNIASVRDNYQASSNLASKGNGSKSTSVVKQRKSSDFIDMRSEQYASCSEAGRIRYHEEKSNDDTKSEIQSLVKLNLKLLSGDKRLGVDTFKEIARFATHTILASCGLDHNKRFAILSFENSACSHIELSQLVSKHNVIPKCQQCLNSFVKNVVHNIIHEKVGCLK